MRLLRRAKGEGWNTHLRGIRFEAKAEENRLEVEVAFETDREIELFFEFSGAALDSVSLSEGRWELSGLVCAVEAKAPEPTVRQLEGRTELVYTYHPHTEISSRMHFVIQVEPI